MKRGLIEYGIPVFLALLLTVLIILLVPALNTRYQLKQTASTYRPRIEYRQFKDLDGDGVSEIVYLYLNPAGDYSVTVNTIRDFTINQFNLRGELLTSGSEMDFRDVNRDGTDDILVCTQKNDSVFLWLIDDIFSQPTRHHDWFIDRIGQLNDRGDYLFIPGGCSDLNGDGHPEYIFALHGGYSLQPRRVYAVNPVTDSVYSSPVSGAGILDLTLADLDGDHKDEILLKTVAPYNIKRPIAYPDSVSWIMILDSDLQFYHPPRMIHPAPSWVGMKFFKVEGERYILGVARHHHSTGYSSRLILMNHSLEVLRTRKWEPEANLAVDIWQVPESDRLDELKVLIGQGVYSLNLELEFTDSIFNEQPFDDAYQLCRMDLEADGEPEYVAADAGKVIVFSNEFRQLAEIPFRWSRERPGVLISLREEPGVYPQLAVQAGPSTSYYRFGESRFYSYRLLIWCTVFLALSGLFYAMVRLQSRIISRRYEKERLIGQLQLQSIRNQLDPHFTFNALNAVGSLIYKGEKELAYSYLKGVTDLLRMVSSDPDSVTWTLADELEFVLRYLEIEKLRFREKFLFSLDVEDRATDGESLRDQQIPKLSILTFVENALKHGLRHKERDRQLHIRAFHADGGLRVTIRDNGIGRNASALLTDKRKGSGLKLMDHYFRQFTDPNGKRASFEVRDLFGENRMAAGTLVEITIA